MNKVWGILLTALVVAFYKDLAANNYDFNQQYFFWYGIPFIILILLPIISKWKKHKFVYKAEWVVLEPEHRKKTIADKITIDIDILNRARGKGANQKGEYHLYGNLGEHTLTMIFNGDGKYRSGHSGVVFLKKSADFASMRGDWIQISSDDDILKGTVKLITS